MKKILILFWLILAYGASAQDTLWLELPNSTEDDYMPFFVDNTLFFTSTRKSAKEAKLLEKTEKVYYVPLKEEVFGKLQKLSYKANSDANSALVGLNSENLYFYKSFFPDNGEIFIGKRTKKIAKIENLEKLKKILTKKDENSIATKGDTIFFTSNRNGSYDLFFQIGKEKPEALTMLNSGMDENSVWIQGNTLYFSSNVDGNYDIFLSEFKNGTWQYPTKLPYPINSEANDQDFRVYDTIVFFSSDRSGMGKSDLFGFIIKPKTTPPVVAYIPPPVVDSTIVVDTTVSNIPPVVTYTPPVVNNTPEDTIPIVQITTELNNLDLLPFIGEIQVGAYRGITSIDGFQVVYNCLDNEIIKMVSFENGVNKFIVDHVYYNLDSAITKQKEIIERGCLPQTFKDMPFIGLLNKNGDRFAIFWKREQYTNKQVLYLYKNNKEIWKSK